MDNQSFELTDENKVEANGIENMPVKVEESSTRSPLTKRLSERVLVPAFVILVITCIVLIALLVVEKQSSTDNTCNAGVKSKCDLSILSKNV